MNMAYEKIWANNEKLNKNELKKLEKDGLTIFEDIKRYAAEGFEAIPKEDYMFFKWAGLTVQKPQEEGNFMLRVKAPSGIMTNEQAVTFAHIANEYGRDVLDLTTRQAIQYHWLRIEQLPGVFDKLKKVGLTSSEAEGDAPRNIMGNPLAGIDPDELFDTRPVVDDVYHFFQDNPDFSNLPRKFKISINASAHNPGHAEINCLAFTPATKVIDGKKVKGFHVKVGGGLAAKPYLAERLDVFIRPEQTKDVAAAVATIFRDDGYRKSRARARLKYLVADWGAEKFQKRLFELTGPLPAAGQDEIKEWNGGYLYGVHPQIQTGYSYIGISIPVGRIHSGDFYEIARLAKSYGNGELRLCSSQNIVIPYIPDEKVDELLAHDIFRKFPTNPPYFTGYAMSCTGNEFCNLALTETKERMREIAAFLDKEVDIDVPVRINMVGCTNSCGQRHIADIGLQGIKLRTPDKKMVEAYEIFVGGTLSGGGHFNERLKGRIAASLLPDVLKDFLLFFKEHKETNETFYTFKNRLGIAALQEELDHILDARVQSA